MNETARLARNSQRLNECHPAFALAVRGLLTQLEAETWRPRIQDAWRNPVAQREAFLRGTSDVLWGMHNATTPGGGMDSLAVDLIDDDRPLLPRIAFILRVNELVDRFGLVTGILWSRKRDGKLTDGEKARIVNACSTGDWSAVKRIGFDPLHVQVAGITVPEAKAGKRPSQVVA